MYYKVFSLYIYIYIYKWVMKLLIIEKNRGIMLNRAKEYYENKKGKIKKASKKEYYENKKERLKK